jgi:hypothetical protein
MKIGDTVSVIDDVFSGKIVEIIDDTIKIITDDGFEMEYFKNELVVMADAQNQLKTSIPSYAEVLAKENSDKKPGKTIRKDTSKSKKQPPMEVDLHIEKLIPSSKGLDNYDILTIQLNTVKNKLQFAFQKNIRRIVFIHGVGEGVLKEELGYLLRKYDGIDFYDADYQKYGVGATEVYILQNKNTTRI